TVLEVSAILDFAGGSVHRQVDAPGTIRRHRLGGPIRRAAGGWLDDHGCRQIEWAQCCGDPVDRRQIAGCRAAASAAPAAMLAMPTVLTRRRGRAGRDV